MVADALPDPLVPADVDFRSHPWFPLKHKQLRRSAWWLRASDKAKAISIELWCASYEEVPAGSVPDDDMALSDAVGFGRRDLTQWLSVKDEVMGAWVLCNDGRWYHPTMAEVVLETLELREGKRARERLKKQRQRGRQAQPEDVPQGQQGDETPRENDEKPAVEAAVPRAKPAQHTTEQDKTGHKGSGGAEGVGAAPKARPAAKPTGLRPIPLDWCCSEADKQYAIDKGLPPEDVAIVEEEFFTYWRSSGKLKKDWGATWRNNVAKTILRRKERGHGPRPGTDRGRDQHQDRVGSMLEGAVEAVKRHQRR